MLMLMLMLMLGLTFIYNPQTNSGFVYLNNTTEHVIILIDPSSNVLRYYRGIPDREERADKGLEAWIQDKVNKGLPFKSMIIPFRQQQQRGN